MNIIWLLYFSLTVDWVSLGCGQNQTFEDFCVCNFMSIFSSILWHFLSGVVGIPLDSMQLNLSNTAVQYTGPVYHIWCLLGQECSLVHNMLFIMGQIEKYRGKGKGKVQLLEMQNTAKQHVLNLDKSVCASPKIQDQLSSIMIVFLTVKIRMALYQKVCY